MQTLNYWKQFEHTGRVEDYLSYVSSTCAEAETIGGINAPQKVGLGDAPGDKREKAGAYPYAGIYMGNRNDIEADAHRGI